MIAKNGRFPAETGGLESLGVCLIWGLLKGPFTQAIFVSATICNFCRPEIATSKSHV